jgi:DNA-directed RNA polymerase alpha subunit
MRSAGAIDCSILEFGSQRRLTWPLVSPKLHTIDLAMNVYQSAHDEFHPLGVSKRTINALINQRIFTLNDLLQLSEAEAAKLPGIGKAAFDEIRIYLKNSIINGNS